MCVCVFFYEGVVMCILCIYYLNNSNSVNCRIYNIVILLIYVVNDFIKLSLNDRIDNLVYFCNYDKLF